MKRLEGLGLRVQGTVDDAYNGWHDLRATMVVAIASGRSDISDF
jgi:hypothetical protein